MRKDAAGERQEAPRRPHLAPAVVFEPGGCERRGKSRGAMCVLSLEENGWGRAETAPWGPAGVSPISRVRLIPRRSDTLSFARVAPRGDVSFSCTSCAGRPPCVGSRGFNSWNPDTHPMRLSNHDGRPSRCIFRRAASSTRSAWTAHSGSIPRTKNAYQNCSGSEYCPARRWLDLRRWERSRP